MSKPYSRETIAHALSHHEGRDALRTVSPPEPGGRKTWRVAFPHFNHGDPVEFTEPQAWALCIGLAASEDHAQNEQSDGPACLDADLELEVALLRRVVRMAVNLAPAETFSSDPMVVAAIKRATDETARRTRCGIHGDDTTSGRCYSCDVGWLRIQLAKLDEASTLTAAEGPYAAVVELCERQPRLVPVVLAWERSDPAEATT